MLDPLSLHIAFDHVPAGPVLPTRKLLHRIPGTSDFVLEQDYSSLSNYMECPRSWENYAIRSREASRSNQATFFGQVFHSCEDIRLKCGLNDTTRQRQRELIATEFMKNPTPTGDYRTAERMNDVLDRYYKRYFNDGWPSAVIQVDGEPMVERAFKIPLCTIPINRTLAYPTSLLTPENDPSPLQVANLHVYLTGRIDAVILDNGLIFIVDHKTSSRGGSEFEQAFILSNQTRGYTWAGTKLLKRPIAGLIMNAVIIRPITPTGKHTELDRKTYFYRPDQLEEYERNMLDTIESIAHRLVTGYFPQHSLSFKSPCAGCDYADNCRLSPEQRPADLTSDFFTNVTWNPIH